MLTFNKLYQSHAQDVYQFALWLSGSKHWAEDITSETFVRAWVHYKPIRTKTLKAYLFTIARNYYLTQVNLENRFGDLIDEHIDQALSPHKNLELNEMIEQIRSFLLTLVECDRTAFVLRVQHDLPYKEIASTLGISVSSAKVKVHRVRKKLTSEQLKWEE